MHYLTERITTSPDLCNGKPTIRGLRITVQTVLEFLFAGGSVEEVLKSYPSLGVANIKSCYDYALQRVSNSNQR
ncbi:MAG: hypothetical protein ACI9YE_001700 [Psychroserpens sp.]|jgi:uncharacterized protein (DUF433 family)